jgi:hypothetical protein
MNTGAVNPAVEKVLQENEEWNRYVKGAFASTRERESKIIGGYMPTGIEREDKVKDIPDDSEESQKIRHLSNFSDAFITDFNPDEDELDEQYEGYVHSIVRS